VAAPAPAGVCPAERGGRRRGHRCRRPVLNGGAAPAPASCLAPSSNFVKSVGFLFASLAAWYLGWFFAVVVSKGTVTVPITNLQQIVKKPVLKAPVPKRQKCDHWSPCSPGDYAYRILSGGGTEKLAKICFEDDLLISEEKGNVGRGINIAIVNYKTGKATSAKYFDMWQGDHSGELMNFIKNAPEGSLLLMVTHDDGSTGLKNDAKKLVEELGSKQIWNMKFRSSWAFIAAKGFKLPDNIQKEKVRLILFSFYICLYIRYNLRVQIVCVTCSGYSLFSKPQLHKASSLMCHHSLLCIWTMTDWVLTSTTPALNHL
uniref:FAM3 metabolism regulating signaling molecule B n=1 Tax=Calidris pygmaea TaxID=425635 RepID=A0A8C3K011_9CHAR